MFTYRRTIFLSETDATGVLYFSEQLKLALEALEVFFLQRGLTLQQLIEAGDFLMPIVHSEADYSAPMRVGDQVEIDLSVEAIGNSSISLITRIHDGGKAFGTTKIVHVVVSKETGESMPIPKALLSHFRAL